MQDNRPRQANWIVFSIVFVLLTTSAVVLLGMNWLQQERNPERPGERAQLVGHDPAVLVGPGLPDYAAAVPGIRFLASVSHLAREDCLVTGTLGVVELANAGTPGRPGDSTLVMWPEGTTPLHEGNRIGVVLPDGTQLLAGERFEGVGGRYDADVLRLPRGIPASCGLEEIVAFTVVGDAAHEVPDCPDVTSSAPPVVPGKVCVDPRNAP